MWPFNLLKNKASTDPRKKGEKFFAGMLGPVGSSPGAWGQAALSLRQIQEYTGFVYRAVDFIGNHFAAIPPVGVKVVAPGTQQKHAYEMAKYKTKQLVPPYELWRRRFVPKHVVEKAAGSKPYQEEYEFLEPDHPLNRILADPNGPTIGYSVWYLGDIYLELTGLSYFWKERDKSGQCVGLWNLPVQWVNPISLGENHLIDFYEIMPVITNPGRYSGGIKVDYEDIICIKKASPFHPVAGYSAVQAGAAEIDTYKQVVAARFLQLQNSVNPGCVIEMEPGYELNDEQMARAESRLSGHYQGVFNTGRPLYVQNGKYVPLPTGKELEYMESQEQLRKHVLCMFGIDEAWFFSQDNTYAGAIDSRRKIRMDLLNPRLSLFAGTLTEQLARDEFGEEYRVIYPEVPLESPKELIDKWKLLSDNNAVTTNEMRQAFGLEPRDEPECDMIMTSPMNLPIGSEGLNQAWNPVPESDEDTKLETVGGE